MIKFGHESTIKIDKIPHVALKTVALLICIIYHKNNCLELLKIFKSSHDDYHLANQRSVRLRQVYQKFFETSKKINCRPLDPNQFQLFTHNIFHL